jgi:hypothetical protein
MEDCGGGTRRSAGKHEESANDTQVGEPAGTPGKRDLNNKFKNIRFK